jgi:hypothetical protein
VARDDPRGAFRGPQGIRKNPVSLASDADAPRETLYLCMRERGKSAAAPESPEFFRTKCGAHSPMH